MERLVRVSPAQAALAAELVRDAVLMRQFLERAAHKDPSLAGKARFALPLSGTAPTAHVIVAPDGNPVTCLAPDMPVHDAATLPHSWVAEFAQEARAAMGAAQVLRQQALDRDGGVVGRLATRPHGLVAQDFAVLETLAPLLQPLLVECVQQAVDLFRGAPPPVLMPTSVAGQRDNWNAYVRGVQAMAVGGVSAFSAHALVVHAATPDVWLSVRAAHAAAVRGAETVAALEDLAQRHGVVGGEHEVGVAAALQQPLLAGRVRALLKALRKGHQNAPWLTLALRALDEPRRALDQATVSLLPLLPALCAPELVETDPQLDAGALAAARKALGDLGDAAVLDVAARMHRALPALVQQWRHGPPEVSVPMWRRLIHRTPVRFNLVPLGTLLVTQAPRAALLPDAQPMAELAQDAGPAYLTTVVPALLRAHAPDSRTGPNAPCPCGSGRKYKKCHGATR